MMKEKCLTFFLSGLCVLFSFAQDPHFSQYYASQLTLNPAMTGFMEEDSRVSANFRSQYWSVGGPFTTGTISYDYKLNWKPGGENDVLALGFTGLYDRSANGGFKTTNMAVSSAFHKSLDGEGKQLISAGFQAAFCSKVIDATGLRFASQFASGGFDRSLPSNEQMLYNSKNFFDVNTGLLYSSTTDNLLFYAGASAFHIGRPVVSFFNGANYRLPVRYGLHGGARINMGDYSNDYLFLSGSYMSQAGATDKIIGAAYGINCGTEDKNMMVCLGAWCRIGDAIIPYFGFNWESFQLGATYDIINSGLKLASPRTGGFELSLNYYYRKPKNFYTNYKGGRIF